MKIDSARSTETKKFVYGLSLQIPVEYGLLEAMTYYKVDTSSQITVMG